jgi:hypothetical protein
MPEHVPLATLAMKRNSTVIAPEQFCEEWAHREWPRHDLPKQCWKLINSDLMKRCYMDGGNEQPVRVLDRRGEERRVGLVFANGDQPSCRRRSYGVEIVHDLARGARIEQRHRRDCKSPLVEKKGAARRRPRSS